MREIKFRAWHRGARQMFENELSADIFRWLEKEDQPIEIMQFTGLKDKNGVEIYCGDVLEYEDNDHKYVPEGIKYIVGVVEFGPHSIGTGCQGHGMGQGSESVVGFYVKQNHGNRATIKSYNESVIGNIHENPELIK